MAHPALEECWVTTALNECECIHALVLAKSLQRVMTSRKLLVLISDSLPGDLWEILQNVFDVCIRLKQENCIISFTLYAKLFCWNLTKWNKIVFLEPTHLVLKNSDELFKRKSLILEACEELSCFVMKPSLDTWKTILNMATNSNFNLEKVKDIVGGCDALDSKYSLAVDLQNGNLIRNIDEIVMVKFSSALPVEIIGCQSRELVTGYLEIAIFEVWVDYWKRLVFELPNRFQLQYKEVTTKLNQAGQEPAIFKTDSTNRKPKDSIGIVGISCRLPGCNNLDEFWKLLVEGRDAISHPPADRWGSNGSPGSKDFLGGFLKCPIDEFDGKFFGISPKELSYMVPHQRLVLQLAWEALEDAGIDPTSLKNTFTGVYGGAWVIEFNNVFQDVKQEEYVRTYVRDSSSTVTARISLFLGLLGPSIATESGCASSMVAVDMACNSLFRGETDLALACGVNLIPNSFDRKTIDTSTIHSKNGHCRTFDADADGFVRSEGVGVLVLKRYPDACKDRDRIYALIRGTAVVQEAASQSYGTPTKYSQALAMQLSLKNAKVEPKDVGFVETHGTGTSSGDPVEVAAISDVYSKERQTPLVIGSVKTNIGHTEFCSGIASIIKAVLSLKNEKIPPHLNFETLNPKIDLKAIPAKIPLEVYEWKKYPKGKPRIAGVNCLGLSGTNIHTIIQEAPDLEIRQWFSNICFPRPSHLITISAKTHQALGDSVNNYISFLNSTDECLGDICHAANTGRAHFAFRKAVVGTSISDMLGKLKAGAAFHYHETKPKICYLFTGQGSQYPGMAKSLYDHNPTFKITFDICHQILKSVYGISIKDAVCGEGNPEVVNQTLISQTSIFCVEYCIFKLYESWGVKPDYVLGHSLGEFAAAVAAGILTFEDALKLVAERTRLIEALSRGKMLVVKAGYDTVRSLLSKFLQGTENPLDYAAFNSMEQTVLSGSEKDILAFSEFCKSVKIKTHVLEATHAFHSRHMDPMLKELEAIASTVDHSTASCIYVSGMEGRIITENDYINANYWMRHTRDSVQFMNASKTILEEGCNLYLEVGPKPILSALITMNANNFAYPVPVCLPSIKPKEENWTTILNSLGILYTHGMDVDWNRVDQFENWKKVTVPFYPFERKVHSYNFPVKERAQLHPLIGTSIPNASNLKIFTNNLQDENAHFLKDYVIGSEIVFPEAAFLEMCLAAGYAAIQGNETFRLKNSTKFNLKKFIMEKPLGITEGAETKMQVLVRCEDLAEATLMIYSEAVPENGTQNWIRHASATFYLTGGETAGQQVYKKQSFKSILARCAKKIDTKDIYKEWALCGRNYGLSFQSLKYMWKGEGEAFFEVCLSVDNTGIYACHPVALDALFQAVLITTNPDMHKLHVLASVQEFSWFAKTESKTCYIHCLFNSNQAQAALYDDNGHLLTQMKGVVFKDTSQDTIKSSLECQKILIPSMFENVWKPELGPEEARVNLLKHFPQELFDEEDDLKIPNEFKTSHIEDKVFIQKSNQYCALYMIKCLYDLGWIPELGKTYHLKEMIHIFHIKHSLKAFLRYILIELAKDRLFEMKITDRENAAFKLVKFPPSIDEIQDSIQKLHKEVFPFSKIEMEMVSIIGQKLSVFLTGKESVLPILFPDNSTQLCAETMYIEARPRRRLQVLCQKFYTKLFQKSYDTESEKIVRILEVGAGTGNHTRILLNVLKEFPEGCEYTYTDISPTFFTNGQKIFENSNIPGLFRVFDIEKDALSQGFIPNYFDLIVADNVVHATKSIVQVLQNLRQILRDNGIICIAESIKPLRNTNIIVGPLDGYWLFEDFDLRQNNCEIDSKQWENVLIDTGFDRCACFSCFEDHLGLIVARAKCLPQNSRLAAISQQKSKKAWLIFTEDERCETFLFFKRKLSQLHYNVISVTPSESGYTKKDAFTYSIQRQSEIEMIQLFESVLSNESQMTVEGVIFLWAMNYTSSDYAPIVKPCLFLCKHLYSLKRRVKLFVFTTCVSCIEKYDDAESVPVPSLLWGMTQSLQNEKPEALCKCIDLEELEPGRRTTDQLSQAFSEIFIDDQEKFVSYRRNKRLVLRLVECKNPNAACGFDRDHRFNIQLPLNNSVTDLRLPPMEKTPRKDSNLEVQVKAYALTDRNDFAVVTPSKIFENMPIAMDFAGVVTRVGSTVTKFKVGDAVFGMKRAADSMPIHAITSENFITNIPYDMTFNEAVTLPVAASTAYLCLMKIAKLTALDIVLIHTASGGVGLAAIQIAKSVGATIVATEGSTRKRTYLKNLGIKYVFDSRNANYDNDIRLALQGHGVDVVLNTSTNSGFKEASLRVCNKGARFIEMNKLNAWSAAEVRTIRPDVHYNTIDVTSLNRKEMAEITVCLENMLKGSVLRPLPYVRFDACDICQAQSLMKRANHIGKIVCVMPDTNMDTYSGPIYPLFSERGSYLITGGLGGIGFEVAKWMVKSGAKHIALVSRRPPNDKTAEEIQRINSSGKNLVALQFDVGDVQQCGNLLRTLKNEALNFPPLKGIMHAAGVLSDGVYANQTWEKFEETYNPKVKGGWNLHTLTLDYNLEHFVLFSSVVACVGSLGQSNHSSANMFLDALAFYRNSLGLAATTINWGQWAQVGIVANKEVIGLQPFTVLQGIAALEQIMKSNRLQTCVFEGDYHSIKKSFPCTKRYFEELQFNSTTEDETSFMNKEQVWDEYDNSLNADARYEVVFKFVRTVVGNILKLDKDEIEGDSNFQALGMDSLMTIELKNTIRPILEKRTKVPYDFLSESCTLNEVSAELMHLLSEQ